MQKWDQEDLAYIHDVGFRSWAIASALGLLKMLAEAQLQNGFIVDLGCGSGLSARKFVNASYRVLGFQSHSIEKKTRMK